MPSRMSGHARANAEIILALSKMGIYMERDRTKLDALSPSTQNTRLRKAFDRAVENCCIFQLLFQKEQREMGKLVLTGLPEWDDWRVSRGEIVKQGRQNAPAELFVKCLGTEKSLYESSLLTAFNRHPLDFCPFSSGTVLCDGTPCCPSNPLMVQ